MTKNYTNEYKFKVVLETIKGDLTIAQIISKYQISKSIIHKWKKQFLENGSNIFGSEARNKISKEPDIENLHTIIGKLKVENDFLQKAWGKVKD